MIISSACSNSCFAVVSRAASSPKKRIATVGSDWKHLCFSFQSCSVSGRDRTPPPPSLGASLRTTDTPDWSCNAAADTPILQHRPDPPQVKGRLHLLSLRHLWVRLSIRCSSVVSRPTPHPHPPTPCSTVASADDLPDQICHCRRLFIDSSPERPASSGLGH